MINKCSICNLPKKLCQCFSKQSSSGLKVNVEKRKYNKPVTVVSGLSNEDSHKLFKELKGLCACGGTIKNDTLELQGDQKTKVLNFFEKKGL